MAPWSSNVISYRTALFRQVNKDKAYTHHDALEFPDGKIVLLTTLKPGQQATVLQLPAEPQKAREELAATRAVKRGLADAVGWAKPSRKVGMTVTLRRDDGREQSFRIVGEDKADPSRGTVSFVSSLARAVLTHGPGETVEIAGREGVILDVR
jgi:hypothetical protein